MEKQGKYKTNQDLRLESIKAELSFTISGFENIKNMLEQIQQLDRNKADEYEQVLILIESKEKSINRLKQMVSNLAIDEQDKQ